MSGAFTTCDGEDLARRLSELFVACAFDLFGEHARQTRAVEITGAEVAGPSVVAMVGFAGRGVRGSVLLQASRELARALRPPELAARGPASDTCLCDQMGEFANQLVGRVKNRALGWGLALVLATPLAAIGNELRVAAAEGATGSTWHAMPMGAGTLLLRFDVVFDAALSLGEATRAAIAEGEAMMFDGEGDAAE